MNHHEQLNQELIKTVQEKAADPSFIHSAWFVEYHLEIVEAIANELCVRYPDADPLLVSDLVWLHDYEKIADFDNQHSTTLQKTEAVMLRMGYSAEYTSQMLDRIRFFNAKEAIASAPIETQIVSSADGAAHLVGPFYALYWYENPDVSVSDLQQENLRKAAVDWDRKITLPEVKVAFEQRHEHLMELAGDLPASYLSI